MGICTSFYARLQDELKNKLPKTALAALPHSYFIVGDILTLKLNEKLHKHKTKIGSAILKIAPSARSVALIGEIKGKKREPSIEIIAGSKKTETIHKEHGCSFALDVKKIMWSKGNKGEKLRLLNLATPREVIVDMFSGIGYFSIPLAKHKKAEVHAIDINPNALKFLKKNIFLNGIADRVKIYKGDSKEIVSKLNITPDRILMGYFPAYDFFESAMNISKKGTIIHFHDKATENDVPEHLEKLKAIAAKNNKFLDVLDIQQVKSYAPHVWHYVYDLEVC